MTEIDRLKIENALLRYKLGYAMKALDAIDLHAPKSEPDECTPVDSLDEAEDLGWRMAKFNDGVFVGIAKSQIAWMNRAAKAARSADDIREFATLLRLGGWGTPPPTPAPCERPAAPVRGTDTTSPASSREQRL